MNKMTLNDIQDEKDLIEFGEAFFEQSAKGKARKERQWLLNIAFIAGDQLTKINSQTGGITRIETKYDPEWMIRMVDNRILPVYRTMIAKLTKNKPIPSAKAHSKEEKDIQAARAAVKLLEYKWNILELNEKHPEMAGWLVATGNVFAKQFWNPKKGQQVIDLRQMDAEKGLTSEGLPQLKVDAQQSQIMFNLGETDLVVRSPFNCYPQPGKTNMRDMQMFGDAELMSVDEIKEMYGKDVPPERDNKYVKVHKKLSDTIESGYLNEEKSDNMVTVKELYILPCKRFPNGAKVTWANNVILDIVEECKEIPLVHIGLIFLPGQFWSLDIIKDLIPIQRRWNHLLSKIEMHNDYYNDPPFMYDPDLVNIDEWTTEPGLGLPVEGLASRQGKPVQVVDVPPLDPNIYKELEILDQQFEIIPILNKVSYGKETPNAKSGVAINFLQEKDEDVIRPLIDEIETGYAKIFKRDFKLCQENYEEDRGFAVVGEDNKIEWVEFTRANLEVELDIGVEPGSAMPRSKVAQQAMVMDMLEAGFFTDPRTGKPNFSKALKYMEFGSVDDIYGENALDSNQAKREQEKIKEGIAVMAEYWHNHDTHLYEHFNLMKTADYENWPEENRKMLKYHITTHEFFLQQQQTGMGTTPEQQVEQANMFLQHLQSTNPELYNELMQLPEEERLNKVMQTVSQFG
jgi:hypothetical protein